MINSLTHFRANLAILQKCKSLFTSLLKSVLTICTVSLPKAFRESVESTIQSLTEPITDFHSWNSSSPIYEILAEGAGSGCM